MIARLGMVLYWCGLAIASLCAIAAIVVFFAIIGGISWLAGRACIEDGDPALSTAPGLASPKNG
jgi:hypothetical protein